MRRKHTYSRHPCNNVKEHETCINNTIKLPNDILFSHRGGRTEIVSLTEQTGLNFARN